MNAVEEIQVAIDKLTASKPHLTACPAFQRSAVRHIARNCDIECDIECDRDNCGWDRYETAPALDMLIRTLDAQLALLRNGLVGARMNEALGMQTAGPVLALARAITGGA
jgi:hypothetical protein